MSKPDTITVDRRALTRAIALTASVVERRNTIPVLGQLKAVANGCLALEGSDLDTFARAELPYTGGHASFCLPEPRRLMAAINHAGGETVLFSKLPDVADMAVVSGAFDGTIRTNAHVDDHPGAELVAEEVFGVDIGAAELRQIARVFSAISSEETRYYLNGVAIFKVGDWLWRFVATDGHRLMMVEVPLPGATGTITDGTIVPRAFMTRAIAHFARSKEPVRLAFGYKARKNEPGVELPVDKPGLPRFSIAAQLDSVRFTLATKLIDGTYPDYTRVVPGELRYAARMQRADLARAVNAMSSIATEKVRAVKLTFAPKSSAVTVSLKTPDLGEGRFTVPCNHNMADGFEIGFNGQYLLDMLAALKGDEVQFGLTDAGAPTVIEDPADTSFKGVLIPMRV